MKEKLFTKNFTMLILGQSFSLFGNYILKFALSMYVLEQTGSATIFASLLAIAMIPTVILSPFAGMLADRANRKNMMVILDVLSGVSVLITSLLFDKGNGMSVIGTLLVVLSVLGAFESPTVQACVPQMLKGDNIIRGNAVVNQVASIAALIAPFLGSLFYTAFGMKPVLYASMLCFWITALFECFITLSWKKSEKKQKLIQMIQEDFRSSMRFLCKEQRPILWMLLLTALMGFFIVGAYVVGFPFLVRNVLKLSVEHYGVAESVMGVATIIGGLMVGFLVGRLKTSKLYQVLILIGVCFVPAGIVFWFSTDTFFQYLVLLISFAIGQLTASVFSIFALSIVQQHTPNELLGKVMAYTSAIVLCTQPLGQLVYGMLFDQFSNAVYIVLIGTGVIIILLSVFSKPFFEKLGNK